MIHLLYHIRGEISILIYFHIIVVLAREGIADKL